MTQSYYIRGTTEKIIGTNRKPGQFKHPNHGLTRRPTDIKPEAIQNALYARDEALRLAKLCDKQAGKWASKALDSHLIDDMEQRRELSEIEDRYNPGFQQYRVRRARYAKTKGRKAITYDLSRR